MADSDLEEGELVIEEPATVASWPGTHQPQASSAVIKAKNDPQDSIPSLRAASGGASLRLARASRVLARPQKRRRRSRSRSWSRSPSPPKPKEPLQPQPQPQQPAPPIIITQPPETNLWAAMASAKAADVYALVAGLHLPSGWLSDMGGSVKKLANSLDHIQQKYLSGSSNPSDLHDYTQPIFAALRALYLLSTQQPTPDISGARSVVQRTWGLRRTIFTGKEQEQMKLWMRNDGPFKALLAPNVKTKKPAIESAPVQKPEVSAPPIKQKKPPENGNAAKPKTSPKAKKGGPVSVQKPKIDGSTQQHPLVQKNGLNSTQSFPAPPSFQIIREEMVADPLQSGLGPRVDSLLSAGKLCLVLDLDHTLLQSVMYSELEPSVGRWLEQRAAVESLGKMEQRELFRNDAIQMYTKLRPGVRNFLQRASQLYELWIHTNGNAAYAATIVSLIDPDGIYFSGRVIAQGAERQENMRADLPKTLERELEGREPITLIIDDTSIVWKSHPRNLLAVERYFYFPSLRAPPLAGVKGRTLLERNIDESSEDGMLMVMWRVIERVHHVVFETLRAPMQILPSGERLRPNWDVRKVLAEERQQILKGVHIVFSRVIPLDKDPVNHDLWKLAELLGARCGTNLVPGVTHLVAGVAGTEKVDAAVAAGALVVSPGWLKACCALWRRVEEAKFQVVGALKLPPVPVNIVS